MKPLFLLATLLLPVFPCFAQDTNAPKPIVFSVGVLPFAETAATKDTGAAAAELLSAQLGMSGRFVLVERASLDSVLSEQGLGISGAVDSKSASTLGKLMGAQILITGRVFKAGETTYCIAKAISVTTGRSLPAQTMLKGGNWLEATKSLAKSLDTSIQKAAADMAPQHETHEQQVARLKKLTAGKKLPSVYISIPEKHLTRVIPDPAVETEIGLILQKLGFVIKTASKDADYTLTGEAFSERASQVGNLISCRARCEIILKQQAAPDQKVVNRVTTGAVDTAENTAAKTALQHAGAQLAEWIVVELIQ
ncbi:hypothetical protein JO972_06105 [Verrucomicrobiaceae bacterium 5K15]|uniref:Curli production assembly/transport component CsgG n=1 Tax=Oceaniferula flava TaxID=2800421 RepID=A0AAE2SCK1_9BACT|nr:CsgG/HfaB family protein [Oceaniferula flavus]MBK1854522.1 hypothetical protein [Oceaniferula flavus]MBM1135828.1 hypothetical protein [Oceaniferula flavus]